MSRSRSRRNPAKPAGGTAAQPAEPGPQAPSSPPATPASAAAPAAAGKRAGAWFRSSALGAWASAHRIEIVLFAVTYAVLASFSSQRFLRQSEAPHFVYQAKAWLDGRLDLDPSVLPNLEDWACVREAGGAKVRCEGRPQPGDRWYVSFPAFPALVMVPFVALHGYQFNDTSFGVFIAALSIALFYSLLQRLSRSGESPREGWENAAISLLLAFGTLFFYCSIRGEVWFLAEVMGVGLTALYLCFSAGARRPVLAGLFFSMATLTRTPLVFSGVFFLMEALFPGPEGWRERLREPWDRERLRGALRKIGAFAAGAAPLAALAAAYNFFRFGSLGEFGHRFLYNNRVNADIDQWGLFSLKYLARNLDAAFFKLPHLLTHPLRLEYDPYGMTLLLTLPLIVFLFVPKERRRLQAPLWVAVACCALPGLFYQNTGYMQFGFRFSLDYTPHLLALFALGAWSLKDRRVIAAAALGILVNFWGAVGFRGYTELVRNW